MATTARAFGSSGGGPGPRGAGDRIWIVRAPAWSTSPARARPRQSAPGGAPRRRAGFEPAPDLPDQDDQGRQPRVRRGYCERRVERDRSLAVRCVAEPASHSSQVGEEQAVDGAEAAGREQGGTAERSEGG